MSVFAALFAVASVSAVPVVSDEVSEPPVIKLEKPGLSDGYKEQSSFANGNKVYYEARSLTRDAPTEKNFKPSGSVKKPKKLRLESDLSTIDGPTQEKPEALSSLTKKKGRPTKFKKPVVTTNKNSKMLKMSKMSKVSKESKESKEDRSSVSPSKKIPRSWLRGPARRPKILPYPTPPPPTKPIEICPCKKIPSSSIGKVSSSNHFPV